MAPDTGERYAAAARLIGDADAIIVCAGAGMGVDSGLPDFRGAEGFWRAYPALGRAKIRFEEVASPATFRSDPALAWGFYGHRLALYRRTAPHAGFGLLKEIAARTPRGGFVFTSNVDGQFQRAGYADEQIVECHGSIHHLQCMDRCSDAIWNAEGYTPQIDAVQCRLTGDMPRCPECNAVARPAILMFDDWEWSDRRTRVQFARYARWREDVKQPVVIEVGAGRAIPTVRYFAESQHCPIIRINPTELEVPRRGDVGIPTGALEGIKGIREQLERSW
ncbi:MAG TPA: Sir2 family NAD-dependent protein deacetylase [Burkholderiales bacterium]|nr:Sir2 family NAD-dependent protein deacetylase [Burkholderiales bacterium]